MKSLVVSILGVIALILVGLVVIKYAPHVQLGNTADATNIHTDVTVQTVTIKENTDAYAINVKYPQFGIPSIDAMIKKSIDDSVAEFKSIPPNPPDSATQQNTYDGSFDSVYVGPDVVSVVLELSQYTGGAHPMTILSGMNFDRKSGKQLLLEDVLPMIGLTREQLSQQVTAQFQTKLGSDFFPEGATSNPENFSSLSISADKVTFIFQAYQVAAYAAGPQQISFPRKR